MKMYRPSGTPRFNGAAVDERRKYSLGIYAQELSEGFNGAAVDERRKDSARTLEGARTDRLQWGRRR